MRSLPNVKGLAFPRLEGGAARGARGRVRSVRENYRWNKSPVSCNGRSCSGQFWKEGQDQAAERHISNLEAHGHQVLQFHHWAGGERSWVHSPSQGLGTNKPPFLSEKLNSFHAKFPLASLWRDSFCHPIHVRCPRLSFPSPAALSPP